MTGNHLPEVPASTVAAPDGCIRVTVKDRFGQGASVIFKLATLEQYLEHFGRNLPPELSTPAKLLAGVKQIAGFKKKSESDLPYMGLATIWIARQNDKSMASAMNEIVSETGRVALLAREMRDGSWSFTVGKETGTREYRPVSGGGILS